MTRSKQAKHLEILVRNRWMFEVILEVLLKTTIYSTQLQYYNTANIT